jgi:outer membrane protein TolC
MLLRFFFIVTFFINPLIFSQVRILSLNELIEIAVENNSDYITSKLDLIKAEKRVSEVYSDNLIPNITLNTRYSRFVKKQTINIFGQNIEIGSDNSLVTTIDITEPIPILGTPVFTGIRIARYYKELQEEKIRYTLTKIRADVKKSYYNILLLREIVNLNRQNLINAEENLRLAEARYRAGFALEYDYIRAKVQYESLKLQLIQSENNLKTAKDYLKSYIGYKSGDDIDVYGELLYDSTEAIGSTDEIIKQVKSSNVALRQLMLNKKINEQIADVDFANYLPKLYLFGQYQIQANENDRRSLSDYRFYNSIVAGIGLTWNLNVFRNTFKEEQSLIEIKKNEEQINNTRQFLETRTKDIILKIEDARNRIRSQKELVEVAERGRELAQISYKNGVINQIDVLDAELSLSRVKLSYLQAVYDFKIAVSELEELLEK